MARYNLFRFHNIENSTYVRIFTTGFMQGLLSSFRMALMDVFQVQLFFCARNMFCLCSFAGVFFFCYVIAGVLHYEHWQVTAVDCWQPMNVRVTCVF